MKHKNILQILVLFAMLLPAFPDAASAMGASANPPADMFQLPWQEGLSWVAYNGFDNGNRRPKTSPHYYKLGGAVDFAPHANMVVGEDTSNYWVTAAAAGVVTTVSSCHIVIDHGNGWTTEYWHLANIQVHKSDIVSRNQKLAVIADNISVQVCTGNEHPGPHLHFVMRPSMKDTKFAGWTINYDINKNLTTFTKGGQTVGLLLPLLNSMPVTGTPTATITSTPTSTATITNSPTPTNTITATASTTATFTPTITATDTPSITSAPPITDTPITNTITPTSTLGGVATDTPMVATSTPTNTSLPVVTDTPTMTPTPTTTATGGPTFPYVQTDVTDNNLVVGESSLVQVALNYIPQGGYTGGEFTCTYNATLLSVGNITVLPPLGQNSVVAINGPQNGSFIVAVVGTNGFKIENLVVVFTFTVTGLQRGQTPVECTARVSQGGGIYTDIAHTGESVQVITTVPSATATDPGPLPPVLIGQVLSSKPVIIRLYLQGTSILAGTFLANSNGTFEIDASQDDYTIVASSEGFLNAQANISLINGVTTTMPTISLIPGDVDGNGVIDQFDALTIGMNYNGSIPTPADLNNDGVINVLDLQLLAAHYGQAGALAW